jgi:molybdopterin-guanine dinucleotide biosynthesis protein MobB
MTADTTVVCLRGPSGSGKTTLAVALIELLAASGLRTGYLKRSHHLLDTAGKDSDRLARGGADAVVVHDVTGAAIFRQQDGDLDNLLRLLPSDLDLVLVETFRAERYPVILTDSNAVDGETLLLRAGRAPFDEGLLGEAVERIRCLVRARSMIAGPKPNSRLHHCAGSVLGRRLARFGGRLLDLEIPRDDHRLRVTCENDGCAAEAIGIETGCRPGNRTLRFRYVGKLAATFSDSETRAAVRVAARGDCRATAAQLYPDIDRHLAQLLTYERLPDEALFTYQWVGSQAPARRSRQHLRCAICDEEVDGDVAVHLGGADYCQPCVYGAVAKGVV